MAFTCTDILAFAAKVPYGSPDGRIRYREVPPHLRRQVETILEQLASTPEGQELMEDIRRVQQTDRKGPVVLHLYETPPQLPDEHDDNFFDPDTRSITIGWYSAPYNVYGSGNHPDFVPMSATALVTHELAHAADPRIINPGPRIEELRKQKEWTEEEHLELDDFSTSLEEYAISRSSLIMEKYFGALPQTGLTGKGPSPHGGTLVHPEILQNKDQLLPHPPCLGQGLSGKEPPVLPSLSELGVSWNEAGGETSALPLAGITRPPTIPGRQ